MAWLRKVLICAIGRCYPSVAAWEAICELRGRATDNSPKRAIEIAGRRRRRRESAVEDQGTAFSPQRADAGKAHCGVLNFYGARGKARRFA